MASTHMQAGTVDETRFPVRATYANLYKWPESDAEFVKRVRQGGREERPLHPGVVDSISCRQIYLKSYTFSRREETVSEKAVKWLGGVKDRVGCGRRTGSNNNVNNNRRGRRRSHRSHRSNNNSNNGGQGFSMKRFVAFRKAKEVSCAPLSSLFKILLACTSKVDVVE